MKFIVFNFFLIVSVISNAQVTSVPDTTNRIDLGKVEIIFVDKDTTTHVRKPEDERTPNGGHWAGIEMCFTTLTNSLQTNHFPKNKYWENDPEYSNTFNFNVIDYKFRIYKESIGITTGFGITSTRIAFRNNYNLKNSADSLYAVMDTTVSYTKNLLISNYLTVPLLIEFSTHSDADNSLFLAAGIVGGVRLFSKTKQKGELDGITFKHIQKGGYSLNPFKLDAMVRLGYGRYVFHASYSLIPLFNTSRTVAVYPFTIGMGVNF
jgi:hypothetical protein